MVQKTICVYCGAKSGTKPIYMEQATELGRGIAENGWRLVYGAGGSGIMGEIYHSARDNGAYSIGVSPKFLAESEQHDTGFDEYHETETMHQRKQILADKADAYFIMPGGVGTLDEFFEILTWRKLGIHAKPIVIVNVDGYWDHLIALLASMKDNGFLGDDVIENPAKDKPADYVVYNTVAEGLSYIKKHI